MMLRKSLVILITVIGILGSVLGSWSCQKGYSGPVESITIGVVAQEVSIPIFIAEDQQFFAHNGLDVTLRYYDNGDQSVNGMLGDEVDISSPVAEYVLVNHVLNKQRIQTVGSMDKLDFVTIVARRDRGVTDISELAGKRIGVVPGTATEFFLGRLLTLSGLDSKEVIIVDGASNPQLNDFIVEGNVDAIVSVPPYVDEARNKLGGNAVSWNAQSGQAIYLLFLCKDEWIEEHPALVERFLRAINQAEEFIVQHGEGAKSITKLKLSLNDEEVSRIWSRNQFSLSLDQPMILAMEDQARWMIKHSLTTEEEVPNFLEYIYPDSLKSVKPDAVRISGK